MKKSFLIIALLVCLWSNAQKWEGLTLSWTTQPIEDAMANKTVDTKAAVYKIRDIWGKKDIGTTKKIVSLMVPPHDVILPRLNK